MKRVKKPISVKVIKESLRKRFNINYPENIRVIRRFTECERDYTEFLYDTLSYSALRHLPEECVTCRAILEDCWVVSKE